MGGEPGRGRAVGKILVARGGERKGGILPCCTAPAMAESVDSCSHCGKQGAGLKRCSRCKQVSYCGAACQNADWKGHKKSCALPVPLADVADSLHVAHVAGDWRGVLKWEGRMEELMANQPDETCEWVLRVFARAHTMGLNSTRSDNHGRSFVGLEERRIPLLGSLQRFRDQGECMYHMANTLKVLSFDSKASTWFQRARDVGAAHGFFSVESKACRGLGLLAMMDGRREEGVQLLRNALVAAELNELDDPEYELGALDSLIEALFNTHAIDEVEPLVLRYREAATAMSGKMGGFCRLELYSLLCSARLHEVPRLCTPHWDPLHTARPLPPPWPNSASLLKVAPRPRGARCTC